MKPKVKDAEAQRPDEVFDVVDARDEVIGRATRAEVHANGLWHRAVHVLVFNAAGSVFLQKRSLAKDSAPGCWDSSCSGHLDAGESYDAAAVRELREEIGLAVAAVPDRWFRLEACAQTGWEFVWVYRHAAEGPFELHPAEIEHGEWFAPAAVTRAIAERPGEFAPAFRLVWAEAALRATEG
jgi:isopentenyl-diphosphate delta-isomerase type 1